MITSFATWIITLLCYSKSGLITFVDYGVRDYSPALGSGNWVLFATSGAGEQQPSRGARGGHSGEGGRGDAARAGGHHHLGADGLHAVQRAHAGELPARQEVPQTQRWETVSSMCVPTALRAVLMAPSLGAFQVKCSQPSVTSIWPPSQTSSYTWSSSPRPTSGNIPPLNEDCIAIC